MKICIFTPMMYPVPAVKGGAVEQLVELIVRVNEKEKLCNLVVVSKYDKDAEIKAKQYTRTEFVFIKRDSLWDKFWSQKIFIYINLLCIKFKKEAFVSMPFVKKAWKEVKNKNIDFYMVEGGGDYYNFGYLAKKIDKNKLGIHFHGEVEGNEMLKKWFGSYFVVSNYIGRKLVCNGSIDSKSVYLLRNCFDKVSMESKISRDLIRNRYSLKSEDFIFVYWGRIIPEKGVLELLEAFKIVQTKYEHAKLLIIGNANFGYATFNEYDKRIKMTYEENQLKDKVVFTGFVQHDFIGGILNACDVGVVPSIWDDPAPLTVFEGFSKGLPMIVTNSGGISEIVNNRKNAIMINWSNEYVQDLSDAMIELINNDSLRTTLSEKCQKDINKYSQDNYYKDYINTIEFVISCKD